MSLQLVIRLGSSPSEEIYYAIIENDTKVVGASGVLKGISELTQIESYLELNAIVVLPSNNFFFKEIMYPKRFNVGMKNSIPFMIEDEVASDVENLEVVVLNIHGKSVNIMAYDKSFMAYVKSVIESYKIKVSRIIPDVFTLPYEEGKITAIALDKEWIFKSSKYSGFCLNETLLDSFFKVKEGSNNFLCLSPLPLDGNKNESFVESPIAKIAEGALISKMSLDGIESSQDHLFAISGFVRPWIKVLIILFVLAIAYVGKIACSYFAVSQENNQLHNELVKVFKTKFPQVRRVVNPMVQFKQLTNQKVTKPTLDSFIKHLYEVSASFSSKVKLLNFRYDGNHKIYTFKLAYQDFDDIDVLREALESRAYQVSVGEIRMDQKQNTAVFTVKEQ